MMTTNFTAILSGLTFGLVAVGIWPEAPFLEVEGMDYVGGRVVVTRQINEPNTIADWRVTVVSAEGKAPSCATIPGDLEHEGWSEYTAQPMSENDFSIDVWVGDKGCLERLVAGDYNMYVTWTPRDGRSPVTAKTSFTRKLNDG